MCRESGPMEACNWGPWLRSRQNFCKEATSEVKGNELTWSRRGAGLAEEHAGVLEQPMQRQEVGTHVRHLQKAMWLKLGD